MRWRVLTVGLLAPALLLATEPRVRAAEICETPEHFVQVEGKLPRTALMAAERKLDILVEGTGSSTLGGAEGAKNAYPARLQEALSERLPGVDVVVRTDVKTRRTAAEMAKIIDALPADQRPGLVIWQTGTVEAIRQMDPDEFRDALDAGVKKLQANGIDVLLVNMQYSPRTEALITEQPYAEAMQWVAQQYDVPLFDRLGVMTHWSQSGVFDLTAAGDARVAERVHACIGRLIAKMIVKTAGLDAGKPKAVH